MPGELIPSYEQFSKQFCANQVGHSKPNYLNLSLIIFVSVQTALQPMTYNQLAANWFQCLLQLHCKKEKASKEVQECFLEYERDIIDMVGQQSYSHFLEQYTTLLHVKFGKLPTCGLRMHSPTNDLAVGGVERRMVSPLVSFHYVLPVNTVFL